MQNLSSTNLFIKVMYAQNTQILSFLTAQYFIFKEFVYTTMQVSLLLARQNHLIMMSESLCSLVSPLELLRTDNFCLSPSSSTNIY